jgi:thiol-disulfide isomerase/thioredoxin
MSKTTNTMFFIFADWCGHCISFRNTHWDSVKALTKKHLKVVEIESAKLEEFEVKKSILYKKIFGEVPQIYFPMIVIFDSNGKRELYKGAMDHESLSKHVAKHYPKKLNPKPKNTSDKPKNKPIKSKKTTEPKSLNIFELKKKLETSLQMLKYI